MGLPGGPDVGNDGFVGFVSAWAARTDRPRRRTTRERGSGDPSRGHDSVGVDDDEAADPVHLGLASEAIGVGDCLSQRLCPVVHDEVRKDCREHVAMVSVDPDDPAR